ncbi:hypothetical protein Tco_0643375 [Tanacetum coccineum]
MLLIYSQRLLMLADGISDEFGVKTGSCKVNTAKQDLLLLGDTKSKIVNNETQIHAKVDGKTIVISESLVRSNLHFNDEDGVASLTNSEILENLALMGYEIVSDKLTFQKAFFSPQWKYLIHTILHCLSSKSTAWNEFSTNIASAVICLANNQKFNFSKFIFDEPFNDTYETPKHTQKVFANMRRKGKSFSGRVTPLFVSMLVPQVVEGEGSRQPCEPQSPPLTAPLSEEGQSGGPLEKVGDEAVHKELGDRVERAATTAASLRPNQRQCLMILFLKKLVQVTDPGGHTPGSDEGRLQQDKLMDIVTALSQKVEWLESDLKKTKKYATAFKKLINRVKSLEDELKFQKFKSKKRRLTLVTSEDPSKQGRSLIEEMDLDVGISLVPLHVEVQGRYGQNLETQEGFGDGQEVSNAAQVSTASTFVSTASPQRNADTTADDLTLAETLMEIRKSAAKDKGKAKMDETESLRKMKQKERVQISRDEEVAQKLQEEFDAAKRQRMAQVHQAAQGFTDSEGDDVLARVAADEDFVQQLQAGEKCSEEDLPMKLVELVNQRKKFFAQQRAEAKRNKPMTPAQQKDYMSNYIKNQEGGYFIKQLNLLPFEQVKDIFETTIKRVQYFVPMGSELEVQRLKRAGQEVLENPDLVKERFSTTEPTNDKEKELWVKLKRLFEPDNDDVLCKLQRSSIKQTDQDSKVFRSILNTEGLIRKLDDLKVNHKFRGGLLGIRGFYNLMLMVQVSTAGCKSFYYWLKKLLLVKIRENSLSH